MTDFKRARDQMVDNQLRAGGVFDWRILGSMKTIARELFVAPARRSLAYADEVQWLGQRGGSRFMAAPATLARLLKLADILPSEDVLLVGAATGYSTAIVASLAKSVIGLEPDYAVAAIAAANLEQLGVANARVAAGDIKALKRQQFDVIIVEGMLDTVPHDFLDRLKNGGRLIAIVRMGATGLARVFSNTDGSIAMHDHFNATLPPLFAEDREEHFVF